MLTERQFWILNSCADDWEIFYFPFADANYSGPVAPRDAGEGRLQYVDDREWQVSVPAEAIAADLAVLVARGFLQYARWNFDKSEREMLEVVGPDDLSMYAGYSCLTFDDHIETYGYGPHEFYITKDGLKEINAPEYEKWVEERLEEQA